jgi:catechol 2,3-dioxygenase-like lactoylglutathione lyase family enzyme
MSNANLQGSLSTALTVNDLKRSIKFYTEGLGFAIVDEYKMDGELAGVLMSAGETSLGLSQDDFGKGRDRVKGVGMRFYIETKQNIDEMAAQAKAAGIKLDEGPGKLPMESIGFTVTDPDGFKMTISNPR